MRCVAATLILSTVLVLSVGCGGSNAPGNGERLSKVEYVGQLEALSSDLQAAVSASVESNFTSPDGNELAHTTDNLADRVEALDPPVEVQDLHVMLVAGLRTDFRLSS